MTVPTSPADVTGPLPTGTSVLEASAGTGKTWTIAALVARYLAEGFCRVDELLVVTFGRAATSDLRSRVRERLLSVHAGLGSPSDDPVVTLLNDGDVAASRRRLATALAAFDSATVTTTHGFCDQVLRSLGVLADLDPGTVLVESLDELLVEAVDDVYLQLVTERGVLPFPRSTARIVARRALADPQATVLPTAADPASEPGVRVELVRRVLREVEARKRALRVLSFDDLLARVRDTLTDEGTGPSACARLRSRFSVVLVDEFQDTDPVQWDVLHSAFHGHRTLVVIGDPKQAVYGFRGADVAAYLTAKRHAEVTQTLPTNWRSDPLLLQGVGALLRGAALGHEEIVVHDVAAGHTTAALGPDVDEQPVRLRVVRRSAFPGTKDPGVDRAREAAARDCASQVVAVLAEGRRVTPRGTKASRPLEARDVAVLVRTGDHARRVREALQQVGVPSVVSVQESVFGSTAAADWLLLLEALEQPHRTGRVRRLALSSFVGLRAADLAADDSEGRIDALSQSLREWADVLAERGVAALFAVLARSTGLSARLLRVAGGERVLTDLRHVSELVHQHALEAELGLSGLVGWLRRQVEQADDSSQERSRRLDTERAAVQIVTVHTSKGLEYPVVMVPFPWDRSGGGSGERLPRGHSADGVRTLHLGGKGDDGYAAACAGEDVETDAEELRLLYVAMTRAVSRLVLWWVPSTKTRTAALPRLLLAPDPAAVPPRVVIPPDEVLLDRLRVLGGPRVAVQPLDVVAVGPVAPLVVASPPLVLRTFDRGLDLAWRRTSYTGLVRDAHAPSVGSEPPAPVKDDEVDAAAGPGTGDPVPMGELPGGTAFGTLVHEVLEVADLTVAGDLERVLAEREALELLPGLSLAVATPLFCGPRLREVALRDVPRGDQLRELDFELPLAGGDDPTGSVVLSRLAQLLRAHLPADDCVRPYAERLPPLDVVRGYLGGSIDLVLRVDGKHHVVDHKTNRLARRDVELTTWHYRREALDAAVLDAHYPLQALLYCVALHRYLRWRQPGYDPATSLGGVRYLFLRGMVGTPGSGVWDWEPPPALVVAVSDLLAGRS